MKPVPRSVHLRRVLHVTDPGGDVRPPVVARMDRGRLWIGDKQGSRGDEISGRQTLLTIAAMIRRYAR